jgi:NTE family protein
MTGSSPQTNRRLSLRSAYRWLRRPRPHTRPAIGLALGGGFARGMAHIGVLRALERHGIPIDFIAGVSAGSIVAAAYASGATPDEIEAVGRSMRFKHVARWTLSRCGFMESDRMIAFLARLLKVRRFEEMRIPLAVVASDLASGQAAVFRGRGDVAAAIRASCAYPGLFTPVRHEGRCLVDGLISMEVPAAPLREMGADRVISVVLPSPDTADPRNMFRVVNRCFQILASRTEHEWRRYSSTVIRPKVARIDWNAFGSCRELVRAGEEEAERVIPEILAWLPGKAFPNPDLVQPVSSSA